MHPCSGFYARIVLRSWDVSTNVTQFAISLLMHFLRERNAHKPPRSHTHTHVPTELLMCRLSGIFPSLGNICSRTSGELHERREFFSCSLEIYSEGFNWNLFPVWMMTTNKTVSQLSLDTNEAIENQHHLNFSSEIKFACSQVFFSFFCIVRYS